MVTTQPHASTPPAAISQALGALDGLGALLNCTDPSAWASMGRPGGPQLASLVYAIRGRLDEGIADLGFDPFPPAG